MRPHPVSFLPRIAPLFAEGKTWYKTIKKNLYIGDVMKEQTNSVPMPVPRFSSTWIPFLVAILLSVIVFFISWELQRGQDQRRTERILRLAELVAADIETDLTQRITALQRMANRWEASGGTPRNEFFSDAQHYIHDMPGLRGIAWLDKDFIARWVVPERNNQAVVGFDFKQEPTRFDALERALFSQRPTMSRPISLKGGLESALGALVDIPLFVRGKHDGFILTAFEMAPWLSHVIRFNATAQRLDEVGIRIAVEGTEVYRADNWDDLEPREQQTTHALILDNRYVITCRPTEALLARTQTVLPLLGGVAGLFLAALIGFVIHLYQRASSEAWQTYAAQQRLQDEVVERQLVEQELQRATARMELAARAGDIGIWEWNVQAGSLTWNGRMYRLYDVPPDVTPKYETWKNALHPEDAEAAEALLHQAVDGVASFNTEFRICPSKDVTRYIRAAARVERDADGNPMRVTGVNWDITPQKQAEQELETQRQRLHAIIRGTNVGTWEWNVQTGETMFNERWAEMIGYTLDEISPTDINTWMKFCHPDDLEGSARLLEKHFSGELEYYEYEARMKHRNGEWIWVLDRGKVASWTDDGEPLIVSGTHQDITRQKRNEERIRHLATHDTLTDLPTLRLAKDRLVMALETARRKQLMAAVLFVDLDGFKAINDTLGHDAGDELLRATARRLRSSVRKVDTVARIGGDEFLVILTELQEVADAEAVAAKVVEGVAAPYFYKEHRMSVGASVGVALCTDGCADQDPERLIRQADEAMYSVKKSGKNGYAFADLPTGTPLA